MKKLPIVLGYMCFCSVTILLINHWWRGLMWYPIVFLWLTTLPLLFMKGDN